MTVVAPTEGVTNVTEGTRHDRLSPVEGGGILILCGTVRSILLAVGEMNGIQQNGIRWRVSVEQQAILSRTHHTHTAGHYKLTTILRTLGVH